MPEIYSQINQLLLRCQRILIISHQRPDEDTLGTALSFYIYLRSLGKTVAVYSADQPPAYLSFMPELEVVSSNQQLFNEQWDLYFFVDCASISNTRLEEENFVGKNILNFDHHISNPGYGRLNLIDIKVSSACELAYNFFRAIGYQFDRRVATNLLSGIMGDTGGFMHSNTSAQTVEAASELIKMGVKIYQIFNFVVRNRSIGGLKLWGKVLSRLKVNTELNVAYTWIKESDFRDFGVAEEELFGLANFLNAVVDVNATAVFRLYGDKVKASWRTKRDDVDLAKLCGQFGGGGHKKASGFIVPWQVVEKDGDLVVL